MRSSTDDNLRARLEEAESALDALRNNEVDAVVGSEDVLLLRLKELEDHYPTLLGNLPDVVFRLDRQLCHLYMSPVAKLQTGKDPKDFLHKTGLEAGVPDAVWQPFAAACRKVLERGATAPTRKHRTGCDTCNPVSFRKRMRQAKSPSSSASRRI